MDDPADERAVSMPLGTSGTIDYVFDGQLWAEWRRFAGADRPVRQPTRVMLEVVIRALGQDGDEIERARSIDPVGAARIDARQA